MPHNKKITELFSLKGMNALVTGGSSGIGFSMAEGLTEAGANVIICSRGKHGSLEEAKTLLSKNNTQILSYKCDLSIPEEIESMITYLIDNEFPIDILVNNAGLSWGHPSESLELHNWQKIIDVNLTAPFLLSKQIVNEFMISKEHGSIINIASVSGYKGGEVGVAGYSASKAGLIGMTKQMAIEWAGYNIRVNAIAPSWFPSYMTRYFTSEASPYKDRLIEENPMKRLGEPWELKGVVVFLASEASSYISGSTIPVDGGLLAK